MDVSPGDRGSVLLCGAKVYDYPSYHPMYAYEEVVLEAVPAFNYRFDYWSRKILPTEEIELYDTNRISSISAGGDTTWLTAHFSQILPVWLIVVIIAVIVAPLSLFWYRKRRKHSQTSAEEMISQ